MLQDLPFLMSMSLSLFSNPKLFGSLWGNSYQVCHTRYQVSFYLWQIIYVLKNCQVPKYYDQDCMLFILAENHVRIFCHYWNIYFWKIVLYEKYWHLVIIKYSTKLCLNFELCFCYCQKNLKQTWIKIASGNGGLSE